MEEFSELLLDCASNQQLKEMLQMSLSKSLITDSPLIRKFVENRGQTFQRQWRIYEQSNYEEDSREADLRDIFSRTGQEEFFIG